MVLCDCGANAECTPEYLMQFAYLGSYYSKRVLNVENPRVGLLNIGAEEEKGDTLRREVCAALKRPPTRMAASEFYRQH
jgi:glycerol-3-phosphate acyltransferase PlsX